MSCINIEDVKSRLREAHAIDMRNALLTGRNSEPLFHDALTVIQELEKRAGDMTMICDKLAQVLDRLKLCLEMKHG